MKLEMEIEEKNSRFAPTARLQKELEQAKLELRHAKGPFETKFIKLMKEEKIKVSPGKGGSFEGDDAYLVIFSEKLCEIFAEMTFETHAGKTVKIGSNYIVKRFKELAKLRQINFALTCHASPLCQHEIEIFLTTEIAISAEEACLSPDFVPLFSNHLRRHLAEYLENHGDLLASERGTERMNQAMLRIFEDAKKVPSLDQRILLIQERLQLLKVTEPIKPQYTYEKKAL